MVDIIRLDHFRGFAGYWEVPAGMPTAEIGRWVPGPGADLFLALRRSLGELPIIAEDLGEITPDVIALRDQFDLPGMKILQFAFSGPENPFLPHHYPRNCVAYTGTHDNDTAIGWYETAPQEERAFADAYLNRRTPGDSSGFAVDLARAVWASTAVFALAPMQDLLALDTRGRMNYPGRESGNWGWRMPEDALDDSLQARIKTWNWMYSRQRRSPVTASQADA
jgi:4-alpha-glucanotransferase